MGLWYGSLMDSAALFGGSLFCIWYMIGLYHGIDCRIDEFPQRVQLECHHGLQPQKPIRNISV